MERNGGRPAEGASPLASGEMAIRAYSYLRFSTPEQMKGDSLRRQTELARRYAAQHGLLLDEDLTFQDLGVSAFRGRNAEAGKLAYFLEAVRSGLVPRGAYLLVESLDRISRQAARRALRVLEEIVDEGITLVTLNDGKVYTAASLNDDPVSLLMALLTFIRANEESATKARRLQEAWKQKRRTAADRPLTARAPAWLRLDRGTTPATWEFWRTVRPSSGASST
jgi:DNA invertase Pin-like site-specific DNA recombinase